MLTRSELENAMIPQVPAIQVDRVSFAYQQKSILSELSFTISRHSVFSILGPSGCGKSTLLSLLGNHESPNTGRVVFAPDLVLSGKARNIVTVFQDRLLFPQMTVIDNLRFALRPDRRGSMAENTIAHAARALSISSLLGRLPSQLSGGQAQRVAIARSLVREPQVMLLDEPFTGLDLTLRGELRSMLFGLKNKGETTIVLVTHDFSEALALSDRILLLSEKGTLAQIGEPRELYHRPKTLSVAKYFGMSNVFRVIVLEAASHRAQIGPSHWLQSNPQTAVPDKTKWVGFHASSVIVGNVTESAANRFRGTVKSVMFEGPQYRVEILLDGGLSLISICAPTVTVTEGSTLECSIGLQDVIFFAE